MPGRAGWRSLLGSAALRRAAFARGCMPAPRAHMYSSHREVALQGRRVEDLTAPASQRPAVTRAAVRQQGARRGNTITAAARVFFDGARPVAIVTSGWRVRCNPLPLSPAAIVTRCHCHPLPLSPAAIVTPGVPPNSDCPQVPSGARERGASARPRRRGWDALSRAPGPFVAAAHLRTAAASGLCLARPSVPPFPAPCPSPPLPALLRRRGRRAAQRS
jgi:hypothetical protein